MKSPNIALVESDPHPKCKATPGGLHQEPVSRPCRFQRRFPALEFLFSAFFMVFCGSVGRAQKTETRATLEAQRKAMTEDRVGFPNAYQTKFQVLRAFTRSEEPKVITVYGNRLAASVTNIAQLPYPYGSVFVFEYPYSLKDSDGKSQPDANGSIRKGEVDHADVMRREKGFGEPYGKHRTGEWEYAGYRLDGSYTTPPAKSASCAECHIKAGPAKDFVFRGKF